ncbi:hypothetical protein GGR28_003790 [Lewinella aquimaris]|uniref:Immunity protein 51 of polymorphic toxin system n=1 Tax=Neolewinella aquimaris TaxID=1835722 RepID=A0A840EBR3_9BACT|nr:Imm51 family immunity protein [Neolewinella aquimaris]MBB4081142.1 hypothetical protein [Neolewinella aquimaris]
MNKADCPFEFSTTHGLTITADIEGNLFDLYYPVFEAHGYSGNGYSWEGHIIQVLEKTDPDLISKIIFDPEAGAFFAIPEDDRTMNRFREVLCPIFGDLTTLSQYLESADRSRIDD